MSVRVLLALFLGVLLAAGALALLVWLLWKLWTHGERKEGSAVAELGLEVEPPRAPQARSEAERIGPAVEEVRAVPPPPLEVEGVPSAAPAAAVTLLATAEAENGSRSVEEELAPIAGPPADEIVEQPAARAPLPGAADDLKLIEGIGPKIAGVLQEAGIDTFAYLARTDADRLRAILREADPRLLRLADPETWPEQAQLAAMGQWDALTELQRGLRGGRRSR